MVCSPWQDSEGLFTPGRDFLTATNGTQMKHQLRSLLDDAELAASLAAHGRETVLRRHACAHRAEQLMAIYASLCSSNNQLTGASASLL
jgi:spore maturation protein CgeB